MKNKSDIKIKKIPIRMCCSCKNHIEKTSLIRLVKINTNIIIDPSYKMPGRGAYICKNITCIKKSKKAKSIEKALSGSISASIYENLEAFMENNR